MSIKISRPNLYTNLYSSNLRGREATNQQFVSIILKKYQTLSYSVLFFDKVFFKLDWINRYPEIKLQIFYIKKKPHTHEQNKIISQMI